MENDPQSGDASQLRRHEQLQHIYGILVELLMHEGRFISERTGNLLTLNSVLFAGYLFLVSQTSAQIWFHVLELAIPVVGLTMSVLHAVSIARSMEALDFWRSSLALIEEDSDYWYPKTEKDQDLDIFKARSRHWQGLSTRQMQNPLQLAQIPALTLKISRHLDPMQIFGSWLPFLLGFLWLLSLVWSCIRLVTP